MTDFRSIRTWGASQDRAFEELCYQLLKEPEDLPPGGTTPIRTGNPDGGVEWYVEVPGGAQWGWQAKYIFDLDPLLGAMRASVVRVTKDRPTLTRLTFCVPFNLSGGTSGGRRSPGIKRFQDAVAKWRQDIPGANAINFAICNESLLLDRLAQPKHAGRRIFWFDSAYLGMDALERLFKQQSAVAGERYRPDLQVDVPIEFDLASLGFSKDYFAAIEKHRLSLIAELRWTHRPDSQLGQEVLELFDNGMVVAQKLRSHLGAVTYLPSLTDALAETVELTDSALAALSQASRRLDEAEEGFKHTDEPELELTRLRGHLDTWDQESHKEAHYAPEVHPRVPARVPC